MGFFLLLSFAFSWPLVLAPLSQHVSQQWDMYTLVWLMQAVSAEDAAWVFSGSAWPLGEPLYRMDSFLMASVAALFGGWLDPWVFPALWTLLGPVLSAWAAERVAARIFDARWPWSLIAGGCFGFCGMAVTSLLEGHVYALLNPWLPLLLGSWVLALREDGTLRQGLFAGVCWSLCLLTSAYTGLVATLLVLVVASPIVVHRKTSWRGLAGAALTSLPVGLAYVRMFVTHGESVRTPTTASIGDPLRVLDAGSIHLDTLAGWNGAVDMVKHSVSGPLGYTALCLALFAPIVVAHRKYVKTLMALALVGLVFALGPQLQLHDDDLNIPLVLYGVGVLGDAASFFHFPSRLLWLCTLGMGMLGAVVATHIAEKRHVKWAIPLLLFMVVDVLCITGAPFRTCPVSRVAPTIYQEAPASLAVLDLFPEFGTFNADMSLYVNNLSCSYQVEHRRPIASQCLGTTVGKGPRVVLSKWLSGVFLSNQGLEEVVPSMQALGFGAIVLHPDFYSHTDRPLMIAGLTEALGPPSAVRTDGGEHLMLFTVPNATASTQDARLAGYSDIEARIQ